jgi:hypothetical protein
MHKEMSLVYFIAFESIELTPDSIMQQAGVPMHYDQASNQCLPYLYICPVKNLLGSPPHSVLHHWIISGNSRPMIPHCFKDNYMQRDLGNGSRLCEVNIWMRSYCRGCPRMVSISEAERIRSKHKHLS